MDSARVDWLSLIDDIEDSFNESLVGTSFEEMIDLYDHCLRYLGEIKHSPIALRDEDYDRLINLYRDVQEDGMVWEQVYTDIMLPLKEITDHIKGDLK